MIRTVIVNLLIGFGFGIIVGVFVERRAIRNRLYWVARQIDMSMAQRDRIWHLLGWD
jgi:uncharacterized protein YneF (UPF0154 family)